MTPKKELETYIESFVEATKEEFGLVPGKFRVSIMNLADKSDPLNQLFVVTAKIWDRETNKIYGWKGEANINTIVGYHLQVSKAIENLIQDMKDNPHRVIDRP